MKVLFIKIILILSSGLLFLSAQAKDKKIDGGAVYQAKCAVCHDKGKIGAPKLGDKKYWQPRLEKGIDKLFNQVTNPDSHVNCRKCSNSQIKEAIKYMATKSGAGNSTLW